MKPKLLAATSALLLASLASIACGGPPAAGPTAEPARPPARRPIGEEARGKFEGALAEFVRHETAHDWTPGTCAAVGQAFTEAARTAGSFPHALFNAGLAYQRCDDDTNAQARFEEAVRQDPSFHSARAKVALYRYKADGNADAAIDLLERAVADGKFGDVAALVDLAAVRMARDGKSGAQGCADDMDCAKLDLHRALAIDDGYMPAHNELALYYLTLARKRAGAARAMGSRHLVTPGAGSATPRSDVQQLELASLVCSQAIRKNPGYAPIHNTHGLIQNELGRINDAVAEFGRAADLDPKFYEAQMNYAAVNLGFRGFEQAQAAYRRAIDARPNDYDAHLGMAVALRGPITDEPDAAAHKAKLEAVASEIARAKHIDPERPDAFFNEAVFLHELHSTKPTPQESLVALERTENAFRLFLTKAKGKADYEAAIGKAKARLEDIAVTKEFLKQP